MGPLIWLELTDSKSVLFTLRHTALLLSSDTVECDKVTAIAQLR